MAENRHATLQQNSSVVAKQLASLVETDAYMKPIAIVIPMGNDIIKPLIKMAWRHQASITVLSACGPVSNVTLYDSLCQPPLFTIEGTLVMTSLSGTYDYDNLVPSQVITEQDYSSFSIFYSNSRAEVFGGVVGGKVKAASNILITALLCKKSKENVNGSIEEIGDDKEHVSGVIHNDSGVKDVGSTHMNNQVLDSSVDDVNVV